MGLYTKKPRILEAEQYTSATDKAYRSGDVSALKDNPFYMFVGKTKNFWFDHTGERAYLTPSNQRIHVTDWVVKDDNGFSVMSDTDFNKIYDKCGSVKWIRCRHHIFLDRDKKKDGCLRHGYPYDCYGCPDFSDEMITPLEMVLEPADEINIDLTPEEAEVIIANTSTTPILTKDIILETAKEVNKELDMKELHRNIGITGMSQLKDGSIDVWYDVTKGYDWIMKGSFNTKFVQTQREVRDAFVNAVRDSIKTTPNDILGKYMGLRDSINYYHQAENSLYMCRKSLQDIHKTWDYPPLEYIQGIKNIENELERIFASVRNDCEATKPLIDAIYDEKTMKKLIEQLSEIDKVNSR